MSKRFRDTDIWDEDWYLDIPLEYRSFWDYVCCKCDHAGIWRPNIRRFNSDIENKIDLDTALTFLNTNKERIIELESGHWMIAEFVPFQYGKNLNLNNRVHLSVFNRLKDLEVNLGSIRGLNEVKLGSSRPQVEVKEGVKDKDKDKVIVISKRVKAFKEIVDSYSDKYPQEMLDEFYNHFAELNKIKTKMLWETFKTWEIEKRLVKWASNDYSGILKGEKNGKFDYDSTGVSVNGYCSTCGKHEFYDPKTVIGADSVCCGVKVVGKAERPPIKENFQSGEIY